MNTPPPPPLHPLRGYSGNPYEAHSLYTQSSYGRLGGINTSDRHADISLPRIQHLRPHIETRRPSLSEAESFFDHHPMFTETLGTSSTTETTANKHYLYFEFSKGGSKWDEKPIIDEIKASQSQIRRRVESASIAGSAVEQLRKMGPNRRGHIDRHTKTLNAAETDGSMWEPIFINNTKVKQKGKAIEVKSFEIVFAKKQPDVKEGGEVPKQSLKPESHAAKGEKSKKERRKSRDMRAYPGPAHGLVNDQFSQNQRFDTARAASGEHGATTSGLAGLFPSAPPEKPRSTRTPRIIPGLDPDADPTINLDALGFRPPARGGEFGVGAAGVANAQKSSKYNENVTVKEYGHDGINFGREGQETKSWSPSHSRSRSRSRSGQHKGLHPNVQLSSHLPHGIDLSCGSSQTSGEAAIPFDEVEELSSYTSEEARSRSPSGRGSYRVVTAPFKQHRPDPVGAHGSRRYELSSSGKTLMPERARRRSARFERPHTGDPSGVEQRQTLVRRSTSLRHKPAVHQAESRPTPVDVPPIAIYPNELGQEADDEDEIFRRDQVVRERETQARMEHESSERETTALRDHFETLRVGREFGAKKGTYTFEPRDHYKPGRF